MSRVETVELDARRRHVVTVWCLEFRGAVVARVTPALVVGHAEDDVGAFRLCDSGVEGNQRSEHRGDECEGTFHGLNLIEFSYV